MILNHIQRRDQRDKERRSDPVCKETRTYDRSDRSKRICSDDPCQWKKTGCNDDPANVPKRSEWLYQLQDRKSKTKYQLDDDGIILTEKAASLLGVKKGDLIKIQRSGDKQITAKISQITENYMQHKVYMTPKLYEKLYHKKAQTTGIYCIEKNISKKKMQENGKQILARDEASTLHFCADDEKTMSDMVNNLNIVVVVLIVSAGLLAFVVLYNLNNINISERRMELATIKVLGFYDGEVGAYVYRENILLTILGTIAGIILGIILHKYVIFTTEVDLIMFGRQIYVQSYIYSILLTIAFSILVNVFVYFQLKKIDMVESLKSTE